MPDVQTTLSFFAVAVLLGFTPGPDNIFVLMQSVSRGRRTGLLVTLGLCAGLCVHTAAVALGLAAVFAASPAAFVVLKVAGAGYLLYLAWQAFRAPASTLDPKDDASTTGRALFVRGVVMNLTNPKVLLFFLAFLPQFVQAGAGPVALQVVWFGLWFIVAYFSDRGRLFQADRGRRIGVAVWALGKRAGTGLTVAESSTISLNGLAWGGCRGWF